MPSTEEISIKETVAIFVYTIAAALYHSTLYIAIKRTFGIWRKKIFVILKNTSNLSYETQVKAVVSTIAIHNFIRKYNNDDLDFMAYDDNPDLIPDEYQEYYNMKMHQTKRLNQYNDT